MVHRQVLGGAHQLVERQVRDPGDRLVGLGILEIFPPFPASVIDLHDEVVLQLLYERVGLGPMGSCLLDQWIHVALCMDHTSQHVCHKG